MFRAIYVCNDKQSIMLTNGLVIGLIPIILVAWLVIMPSLGVKVSAAYLVMLVAVSVFLMCLGFLRTMNLGSGRGLGGLQSVFLLQSVIISIRAASLPMSCKAAVIMLLVTAPFIGYGVGRLCCRLSGSTPDRMAK